MSNICTSQVAGSNFRIVLGASEYMSLYVDFVIFKQGI